MHSHFNENDRLIVNGIGFFLLFCYTFMKDAIHSIVAMVWAINLNVHFYIKHKIAELLKAIDKDGKIE